jgi:type IV pilus assembly protein PilA
MFQRFHAMREQREGGFTLIELLVVILIIAILAAIAIPVFLNQRKKGWIAQEQSALKDAATAMETYATEQNGNYSGANGWDETDLNAFGYSPTVGVSLAVTAGNNDYCIVATHANFDAGDTDQTWGYDSDDGTPKTDSCGA